MAHEALLEPQPCVLVVDDHPDAADALALADVIRPDIVILDISMPRMNGCETARRMRLQPWAKSARIIALSAWGDDETRLCTQQAGMDFHLTKPVSAEILQDVLAMLR